MTYYATQSFGEDGYDRKGAKLNLYLVYINIYLRLHHFGERLLQITVLPKFPAVKMHPCMTQTPILGLKLITILAHHSMDH